MINRNILTLGILLCSATSAKAGWESTTVQASNIAFGGGQLLGSSAVYDSNKNETIETTYWKWQGKIYRCRRINIYDQYCYKAVKDEV